ncbi:MAG: MerR family DNA-binding transcriptional regulator, partial [Candidatus Methylomirabilales bacterium]
MARFFIGQLATEVGLTPKTIRYYETVGLLPPAARTESRYRLYTPE